MNDKSDLITKRPRNKVLVVDDDRVIRQLICEELSKKNFSVTMAGNADEAKKILGNYLPELIILDIIMPGPSGMEFLKELRESRRFKWIPVIFLTSRSSPAEIMEGIKAGVEDYIIKPFSVEDLAVRVEAKIARMKELHGIAMRDPLTGVFSRGYFMERLNEEINHFYRKIEPFSLVICDIDFFKKVNDEHGHLAGDIVLQQFAAFLQNSIRGTDVIGRYGGEEFTILLPDTEIMDSYNLIERLRLAWEKRLLLSDKNKNIKVTFSAGISEFNRDGKTDHDIIEAADAALYRAKKEGRNRIVLAS